MKAVGDCQSYQYLASPAAGGLEAFDTFPALRLVMAFLALPVPDEGP